LAYISVADSMGLSSFKFVQWAPKHASILQQSAGRKRILTSNSRSRSFILQSVTGQQGIACRYIILLALSLKIPK